MNAQKFSRKRAFLLHTFRVTVCITFMTHILLTLLTLGTHSSGVNYKLRPLCIFNSVNGCSSWKLLLFNNLALPREFSIRDGGDTDEKYCTFGVNNKEKSFRVFDKVQQSLRNFRINFALLNFFAIFVFVVNWKSRVNLYNILFICGLLKFFDPIFIAFM